MKKNIVLLLLTVLVVQLCVSSCTYYTEDPFLTDTDTSQASEGTGNDTQANKNSPVIYLNYTRPDDDFYCLSVGEAYEKYGILSLTRDSKNENAFDGKYTYLVYQIKKDDPNSWTLYKIEFPNGKELSPVCTDPLCTHTASSGCPLSMLKGASFICFSDKIFIANASGELLMYDKKTNKSAKLLNKIYDGTFSKYNGELYFYYNGYSTDFESERIIAKISEDGAVTEIKRLKDYYTADLNIYGDRYVLDYKSETCDGGDGKVILYSRDILTDEVKTVTELDCPGAVKFAAVEPAAFYGNKLLLIYRYYTAVPNFSLDDERKFVWLVDLDTKESRLICTPDYYTYREFNFCLFSSKCVVWYDLRLKASDPLVIHVYFPYEDKELTYNFSDMIKAAAGDDNLSLGVICAGNSRSALILGDNSLTVPDRAYEVDLENGNVYKYEYPES